MPLGGLAEAARSSSSGPSGMQHFALYCPQLSLQSQQGLIPDNFTQVEISGIFVEISEIYVHVSLAETGREHQNIHAAH